MSAGRGGGPADQHFEVIGVDGVSLRGSVSGTGRDVLLLHGLTATSKYVLMGSKILQRSGFRVISYDARGHGLSGPASDADAYTYPLLAGDAKAVMEQVGAQSPLLAGISMGAHTAAVLAASSDLEITGAVLITPAYLPEMVFDSEAAKKWDGLSDALRLGGPEGFVDEMDFQTLDERWREVAKKATLQRMLQHRHPDAVADALKSVPRSRPFDHRSTLASIECPVCIIGSRDQSDPGHPLSVAEEWSRVIPAAELLVEGADESPLAWRGSAISKAIAGLI